MRFAEALAKGMDADPPKWLGVRFDADARPLRASGVTVICHITDPVQNEALSAARDRICAATRRQVFAWLPPSSYHMTVFDYLLHQRREMAYWPKGLATDASEAEVDDWAAAQVRDLTLQEPPPFQIAPRGLYAADGGLGVDVGGVNRAEDARLRSVRDDLARAAGLTHRPGHDEYRFHITLAYLIAWPDAAEAAALDDAVDRAAEELAAVAPTFSLCAPELCYFHDMTAFARQFRLR